jgi:hypothetical protein
MNAMATDAVNELREVIGVSRAVALFGLSRSSFYYQPVPKDERRPGGGGSQPNALGDHERAGILAVLHSDAHVDHSPYDVYAALLDEGRYLASIRSFYRILEANGETAARSDQCFEKLLSDGLLLVGVGWFIDPGRLRRCGSGSASAEPLRVRVEGIVKHALAGFDDLAGRSVVHAGRRE